jgi:hypothetical protein
MLLSTLNGIRVAAGIPSCVFGQIATPRTGSSHFIFNGKGRQVECPESIAGPTTLTNLFEQFGINRSVSLRTVAY